MSLKPRLSGSLLVILGALLFSAPGCKTPQGSEHPTASGTSAATNPPQPYLRIAQPDTNRLELQVAVREFVPRDRSQPVVWLTGVSHIGDSNYYARLQQHLNSQDLVLYEGVTDRAARAQHRKSPAAASQSAEADVSSLQGNMATALGLVFQLGSIDYDRPNFRNSDLSIEELQQLIASETATRKAPSKTESEFQKLMELMQGDSVLGWIMNAAFRMIGSSPKLQALAKLMMIETLGRFEGNMAEYEGLPPEWQRLIQILIEKRNDTVLHDLRQEFGKKSRSIAIFYGAAHMDNFERRLKSEMNYRVGKMLWFPAFSVDLQKAQITPDDVKMVKSFVDWQMGLMKNGL